MEVLNSRAAADIASAMLPEIPWNHTDDECDCTYQRIGLWTNPYLAETLEVRWCCIWKELSELFPQYIRTTPAYQSPEGRWEPEPAEWDGDFDMPVAIWYRQLARKHGRPMSEIREEYASRDDERPKAIPRPGIEIEPEPSFGDVLLQMITDLAGVVAELKAKVDA